MTVQSNYKYSKLLLQAGVLSRGSTWAAIGGEDVEIFN